MLCQKCHVVGHVCRENKSLLPKLDQKQQWRPKENEKVKVDSGIAAPREEIWQVPKQVTSTSIQVGNIQISTGNEYACLEDPLIAEEGGDLIPEVLI